MKTKTFENCYLGQHQIKEIIYESIKFPNWRKRKLVEPSGEIRSVTDKLNETSYYSPTEIIIHNPKSSDCFKQYKFSTQKCANPLEAIWHLPTLYTQRVKIQKCETNRRGLMNHMGDGKRCDRQKEKRKKKREEINNQSWTGKEKSHKNILQGVRDKSWVPNNRKK